MEELIVGAEAAVTRGSTPVQDALDKNAQIGGDVGTRRRRFTLDGDAQAGLLRVVDGDVEREDLALFPWQQKALLAGAVHRFHLPREFGARFLFAHFLAGDEESGQSAGGDRTQDRHHFVLVLSRHFLAVDFEQPIA